MADVSINKVVARKAALEAQRDKLLSDLNAVYGAIQDCEHWLSVLNSPEDNKE